MQSPRTRPYGGVWRPTSDGDNGWATAQPTGAYGRRSMHRILVALLAVLFLAPAAPARAEVPSDDRIMDTVKDLVGFAPRRVGTPGIDKTVEYIGRRFQALGLTGVHVEEAPTYAWDVLEEDLQVAGRDVDASPIVYSQTTAADAVGVTSTPEGGLKAPVVDVGLATAAEVQARDVRGKVVLFDLKFLLPIAGLLPLTEFLWDPDGTMSTSAPTLLTANPYITTFTEAIKAAQDGGAVAIVGVLADYFGSHRYWNEFYRRQLVEVPGFWVTKAEGDRLRAQLAKDPAAEARITLKTQRRKVPSHVVVGFLEGKSTDAIQIHSHHDSGYDGAVEDASGVAEVLALAEHYAAQPKGSREKTLMFTTFDSHFSGYAAHNSFLKRHVVARDPKRDPHRIVADVTLEHIAKHALRGPDGSLEVSDLPEPRGVFETLTPALKGELIRAIVRNDLKRTAVLNGSLLQPVGIPTDSSGWVLLGIPTASLISGPLYLYDAVDTIDKVLVDELHEVGVAFAELTDAIDRTPTGDLGLLPADAAERLGTQFVGATGGIPDSVDRPIGRAAPPAESCRAAARGRAVRGVRVTGRTLRFVARRTTTVRVATLRRGGRTTTLRTRRLRACRSYRVRLPRGTRRVELRWTGGRTAVRVRSS